MKKSIPQFWSDFYKNIQYEESYFRDETQIAIWASAGHTIKNTIVHINQNFTVDDFPELKNHFSELKNIEIGLHKIIPGHYLPMHQDKYSFYKKKHSVDNLKKIIRYVVFLEDSKPGHYLIVNSSVYSSWKAGDAVGWIGDTPHSAVNLGLEDRYTLQLTGTYDC